MHGMRFQTDSGRPPTPREQKRILLTLVVMVVLVHAIAITVYRVAHIPERPMKTQQEFVGVWLIATLIVVVPMMKRIRRGRRRIGRTN
jgi:membrane protein YdbS with pleckstrin-like domain